MGYFPETIAAKLAGRAVCLARLVELDFADGVGRYWEGGTGSLFAGGHEWIGTGELSSISGIQSAFGGQAPVVTVGLSGVSQAGVARAVSAETDVKDRPAKIFVQFFDEHTLAPLDQPYTVFIGLMDVMKAQMSGPSSSAISVTIEGMFTGRARPSWGWLSDRAQQGLYPGDKGLSQVSSMELAKPQWPVY